MITRRADVDLITYLNLEEFNRIQNEISSIQQKEPGLERIEEPFNSLANLDRYVFSPSEIKGVGRLVVDSLLALKKSPCDIGPIRLLFSTSCPIELEVSFDITLDESIDKALTRIKDCCKDVTKSLSSLIGIARYRLCFCTLHIAGTGQEKAVDEQLKRINVSFKDVSFAKNAVIFKQQYSDLEYDFYFAIEWGGFSDVDELSKSVEKMPIIEKIGQIVRDGLEDIDYNSVSLEGSLANMSRLIKNSNLDELTRLRMEHSSLKSKLLKYEDMRHSLREYLNVFFVPLEHVLEKEKNGLLSREMERLRQYHLREIARLRAKVSQKLDNIENAIDSSIEIVNITETMKLSKSSLRLEKWMAVLSVVLFIFAVIELLQALKLI